MTLAIAAAALIAALVIRAAAKPGALVVRRSTRIDAPADRVRELVEDFHRWSSWSPYEDLDPVMRRTYSEPAAGTGAVYAWKSGGRAGTGRMTITESSPCRVRIQRDLHHAHATVEFTFRRVNGATEVTWSLEGAGSLLTKLITARDFETGLANLKANVERSWFGPRKPPRQAPRPRPERRGANIHEWMYAS